MNNKNLLAILLVFLGCNQQQAHEMPLYNSFLLVDAAIDLAITQAEGARVMGPIEFEAYSQRVEEARLRMQSLQHKL